MSVIVRLRVGAVCLKPVTQKLHWKGGSPVPAIHEPSEMRILFVVDTTPTATGRWHGTVANLVVAAQNDNLLNRDGLREVGREVSLPDRLMMHSKRILQAGIGRVVITPPIGIRMMGYTVQECVSESVERDLTATALVLSDGETKVAMIACDIFRP